MAVAHNIDVLIQANTGGFDKKLKDSEKKTKEFADKAKPWLESIFGKGGAGLAGSFMTGGAIAAGATLAIGAINLLTGAIKGAFTSLQQLISNGFTSLDALGDIAKRIGISAKSLVTLQLAADQSGSNVEDLNSSLVKMTRNLAEAGDTAGGPVNAALAKLGLTAEQLEGMSVEDKFKAIADGLSGISDSGTRLSIINDIFGKTGQSLNELLSGGSKGIDEFEGKASKLGLLFSDGEIAKVQEAQDAYAMFGHSLSGLGQSFAVALAPLATGLFTLLADNIGGITEALHPVFEQIRAWTPAIIQMANITFTVFAQIMQVCWEFRDILLLVFAGPAALAVWKFGEYVLTMSETVSMALAFVESVLQRWQQVWDVAVSYVALKIVQFGNDCINIFGTVLPNLFINWATATGELFYNLATNVGEAFRLIWETIKTGSIPTDATFKPMFDGFTKAAQQAAKDMARPATALEKELQKTLDEQSGELAMGIVGDMGQRMAELKSLITDDLETDFSKSGGEGIEATVTTKLAPGALERGSSAAFEAIVNAQEKAGDPLLSETIKQGKVQQQMNQGIQEIAKKKNELQVANL